MRPITLLLFLAVLAVMGCSGGDAAPSLAPAGMLAALAADSTDSGDDDDLICDWGPVPEREGEAQVMCYRLRDVTDDTAGGTTDNEQCRYWYVVTYRCRRLECVKVHEDFVGCDPHCFGSDDCDDTQREIYTEYNMDAPHGGHGQNPPEDPADCETIEHHTSDHPMATNFTWGELNGGFADGNPHRGNGGGWGWIQFRAVYLSGSRL